MTRAESTKFTHGYRHPQVDSTVATGTRIGGGIRRVTTTLYQIVIRQRILRAWFYLFFFIHIKRKKCIDGRSIIFTVRIMSVHASRGYTVLVRGIRSKTNGLRNVKIYFELGGRGGPSSGRIPNIFSPVFPTRVFASKLRGERIRAAPVTDGWSRSSRRRLSKTVTTYERSI